MMFALPRILNFVDQLGYGTGHDVALSGLRSDRLARLPA